MAKYWYVVLQYLIVCVLRTCSRSGVRYRRQSVDSATAQVSNLRRGNMWFDSISIHLHACLLPWPTRTRPRRACAHDPPETEKKTWWRLRLLDLLTGGHRRDRQGESSQLGSGEGVQAVRGPSGGGGGWASERRGHLGVTGEHGHASFGERKEEKKVAA